MKWLAFFAFITFWSWKALTTDLERKMTDPPGDIMGLFYFILAWMAVSFLVSWWLSRRPRR